MQTIKERFPLWILTIFTFSLIFIAIITRAEGINFEDEKVLKAMGQALYEQSGANSCVFCHGKAGDEQKNGAANLQHPKKWKTFAALGGEAAYAKNKEAFKNNFAKAVQNLIAKGALGHSKMNFQEPWFDWSKIQPFNSQMQGITGGASSAWLNKQKARGVTAPIAARAAFTHLKAFDKDGVF